MNSLNVFEGLNDKQLDAVVAPQQPLLLIASAGSGKSTTLVRRIAHQIRDFGVHPSEIMAVTFTKKASKELQNKLIGLLGEEASMIWAGTFHSLCLRILRMYPQQSKITRSTTIYDQSDSGNLIKDIMKYLNISLDDLPKIRSRIEKEKTFGNTPDDVEDKKVRAVYQMYQDRLSISNALDFQDIMFATVRMLRFHNDIRNKVSERFRFIGVDEFQDTNVIQMDLIKLLCCRNTNITCIGDPDQSIYAFRYANIENIFNFQKEFPNSLLLYLDQNYRSTHTILAAANDLISKNEHEFDKQLWTNRKDGSPLTLFKANSAEHEAQWIANQIRILRAVNPKAEVTILYRMNFLSDQVERELMRCRIPYRVVAGRSFYQRKEVKDIISYMRLFANPHDDEAFRRAVNEPKRGIGNKTLEKIALSATLNKTSLYQAVVSGIGLSDTIRKKFLGFMYIIDKYKGSTLTESMYAAMDGTGYKKSLQDKLNDSSIAKSQEAENSLNILSELEEAITSFANEEGNDLCNFLDACQLVADQDGVEEDSVKVQMMTVHASKGLEFQNVFLMGFDDGIFPSTKSIDEGMIEEERRLAYVAITRAMNNLFISYPASRFHFGKFVTTTPSRFIKEINKENFMPQRRKVMN